MSDNTRRPVIFGEVLFDRFPDGSEVAGGAPFNVAWHLAAFGAAPLFISRVGQDDLGDRIRALMADWNMDLAGLQVDPDHPTGTVEVVIENGEPRYDIVAERAWDHIDAQTVPALPGSGLLYHGSLAVRSPRSAATLATLRQQLPRASLLDVNLRDPWWQSDAVLELVRQADWVKLNGDELQRLLPDQRDGDGDAAAARRLMATYGPSLVIVTHGAAGAIAWQGDGPPLQTVPTGITKVVDTVGAGDAFASVLLLGRLRGWPLPLTLDRAQTFAARLVTLRGATIHDRSFYQPFIDEWELA